MTWWKVLSILVYIELAAINFNLSKIRRKMK